METLEQRSVARCTDEMARAILYFRALRGLAAADSDHGIDFIRLSYWAIYDQLFSHVIKVLDRREQAGFWFLVQSYPDLCDKLCESANLSLTDVTAIEKKLQHIRDKTHFHLDKRGVLSPATIWKEADLAYGALENAMDTSFELLSLLFKELTGKAYHLPEYDGSDATVLAKFTCAREFRSTGTLPPLRQANAATLPSTD
jgi:hypothetical protein